MNGDEWYLNLKQILESSLYIKIQEGLSVYRYIAHRPVLLVYRVGHIQHVQYGELRLGPQQLGQKWCVYHPAMAKIKSINTVGAVVMKN